MAEGISLGRLHQIALYSRDLDRSLAFYRDVLGLPFLFRAPNVVFFDCAGTRLMLGEAPADFRPSTAFLYFWVPDMKAAAETLGGRGLKFGREPHLVAKLPDREVWLAEFTDPDGNPLALMSEVPIAPAPPAR
jgi:methylmalonyl-CoA/ethylmalonyl-CoA epimerase